MEEICSCECTLVVFSKKRLICPKCNKKKEANNNDNSNDWDIEKWDLFIEN